MVDRFLDWLAQLPAVPTYLVLMASETAERKALYDQLFLPVIDAYTPTT